MVRPSTSVTGIWPAWMVTRGSWSQRCMHTRTRAHAHALASAGSLQRTIVPVTNASSAEYTSVSEKSFSTHGTTSEGAKWAQGSAHIMCATAQRQKTSSCARKRTVVGPAEIENMPPSDPMQLVLRRGRPHLTVANDEEVRRIAGSNEAVRV